MSALVARYPWVLHLVTVAAALLGGLLTIVVMPGCGAGAQQRVVSAVAVAVREADHEIAEWYVGEARDALKRVEDAGGTYQDWCREVAPAWRRAEQVACPVAGLASVARAGQEALDATGGEAGVGAFGHWAVVAGAAIAAVADAWDALGGEPPAALTAAAALLPPEDAARVRCEPTPPPGCEGVLP